MRIQPEDPALRQLVLAYLKANPYLCSDACTALDLGPLPNGGRKIALVEGSGFTVFALTAAGGGSQPVGTAEAPALKPGSRVEIRTVEKRYIFVDGKPMMQPLDN